MDVEVTWEQLQRIRDLADHCSLYPTWPELLWINGVLSTIPDLHWTWVPGETINLVVADGLRRREG